MISDLLAKLNCIFSSWCVRLAKLVEGSFGYGDNHGTIRCWCLDMITILFGWLLVLFFGGSVASVRSGKRFNSVVDLCCFCCLLLLLIVGHET